MFLVYAMYKLKHWIEQLSVTLVRSFFKFQLSEKLEEKWFCNWDFFQQDVYFNILHAYSIYTVYM